MAIDKNTVFIASALMNIFSGGGYVSPEDWDKLVGPVLDEIANQSGKVSTGLSKDNV